VKTAIESCSGYIKLKAAVEDDCHDDESRGRKHFHDYRAKLAWVLDRAAHYAEKTGLDAADILDAWEKGRTYWYMNYYQDAEQPLIEGDGVRLFETKDDLKAALGDAPRFRCPACNGASKNPYECDSGIVGKTLTGGKNKPCDWKVYGLFSDLGKGVYIFVKSEMCGQRIFNPVAWELIKEAK
jgi:hypothetical protein